MQRIQAEKIWLNDIATEEEEGHVPLGARSNTTLRILSVKGGVPPKSVTPLLPKILSVKGGGGVPPISVTYFLDQKQVFFGQKTPFLALFEEHFSGECP